MELEKRLRSEGTQVAADDVSSRRDDDVVFAIGKDTVVRANGGDVAENRSSSAARPIGKRAAADDVVMVPPSPRARYEELRVRALADVVGALEGRPHADRLARSTLGAAPRSIATMVDPRASRTTDPAGRALARAAERHAVTLYREAIDHGDVDHDDPIVDEALNRAGSGSHLPTELKRKMEDALGYRLDRVRIHTDSVAAKAAHAVRAHAFTVGEDIFFAENAFTPGTHAGDKLIAHELQHVVQSWQGRMHAPSSRRVSDPSESLEREASAVATRVTTNFGAHFAKGRPANGRVAHAAPLLGPAPRKKKLVAPSAPAAVAKTSRPAALMRKPNFGGLLAGAVRDRLPLDRLPAGLPAISGITGNVNTGGAGAAPNLDFSIVGTFAGIIPPEINFPNTPQNQEAWTRMGLPNVAPDQRGEFLRVQLFRQVHGRLAEAALRASTWEERERLVREQHQNQNGGVPAAPGAAPSIPSELTRVLSAGVPLDHWREQMTQITSTLETARNRVESVTGAARGLANAVTGADTPTGQPAAPGAPAGGSASERPRRNRSLGSRLRGLTERANRIGGALNNLNGAAGLGLPNVPVVTTPQLPALPQLPIPEMPRLPSLPSIPTMPTGGGLPVSASMGELSMGSVSLGSVNLPGGITINGPTINGPSISGPSFDGRNVTGLTFNAPSVEGPSITTGGENVSRPTVTGPSAEGPSATGPSATVGPFSIDRSGVSMTGLPGARTPGINPSAETSNPRTSSGATGTTTTASTTSTTGEPRGVPPIISIARGALPSLPRLPAGAAMFVEGVVSNVEGAVNTATGLFERANEALSPAGVTGGLVARANEGRREAQRGARRQAEASTAETANEGNSSDATTASGDHGGDQAPPATATGGNADADIRFRPLGDVNRFVPTMPGMDARERRHVGGIVRRRINTDRADARRALGNVRSAQLRAAAAVRRMAPGLKRQIEAGQRRALSAVQGAETAELAAVQAHTRGQVASVQAHATQLKGQVENAHAGLLSSITSSLTAATTQLTQGKTAALARVEELVRVGREAVAARFQATRNEVIAIGFAKAREARALGNSIPFSYYTPEENTAARNAAREVAAEYANQMPEQARTVAGQVMEAMPEARGAVDEIARQMRQGINQQFAQSAAALRQQAEGARRTADAAKTRALGAIDTASTGAQQAIRSQSTSALQAVRSSSAQARAGITTQGREAIRGTDTSIARAVSGLRGGASGISAGAAQIDAPNMTAVQSLVEQGGASVARASQSLMASLNSGARQQAQAMAQAGQQAAQGIRAAGQQARQVMTQAAEGAKSGMTQASQQSIQSLQQIGQGFAQASSQLAAQGAQGLMQVANAMDRANNTLANRIEDRLRETVAQVRTAFAETVPVKEREDIMSKAREAASNARSTLRRVLTFIVQVVVAVVVAVVVTAFIVATFGAGAVLIAGIIAGALAGLAGQMAANAMNGEPLFTDAGTAMAMGAIGGGIAGGFSAAAGGLVTRVATPALQRAATAAMGRQLSQAAVTRTLGTATGIIGDQLGDVGAQLIVTGRYQFDWTNLVMSVASNAAMAHPRVETFNANMTGYMRARMGLPPINVDVSVPPSDVSSAGGAGDGAGAPPGGGDVTPAAAARTEGAGTPPPPRAPTPDAAPRPAADAAPAATPEPAAPRAGADVDATPAATPVEVAPAGPPPPPRNAGPDPTPTGPRPGEAAPSGERVTTRPNDAAPDVVEPGSVRPTDTAGGAEAPAAARPADEATPTNADPANARADGAPTETGGQRPPGNRPPPDAAAVTPTPDGARRTGPDEGGPRAPGSDDGGPRAAGREDGPRANSDAGDDGPAPDSAEADAAPPSDPADGYPAGSRAAQDRLAADIESGTTPAREVVRDTAANERGLAELQRLANDPNITPEARSRANRELAEMIRAREEAPGTLDRDVADVRARAENDTGPAPRDANQETPAPRANESDVTPGGRPNESDSSIKHTVDGRPRGGAELKAWLDNPANWTPERAALHQRLLGQAREQAASFAESMRTLNPTAEPTLFAMRGNTASGKSRAVKGNVPELRSVMDATADLPHRAVNPDNFKQALAEANGPGSTSRDVHTESSMLARRLEADIAASRTQDGETASMLIDKRLDEGADVQHYADMARATGRRFVMHDVDAPLEASLVGVLERVPGGADPLPPFAAVESGFTNIRRNRAQAIDMFRNDPSLGEYTLYGTRANGDRVPVATVRDGALTIQEPDLYTSIMAADAADGATALGDRTITRDGINEATANLPTNRQQHIRDILSRYEGMTWRQALDTHAARAAPAPVEATPTTTTTTTTTTDVRDGAADPGAQKGPA